MIQEQQNAEIEQDVTFSCIFDFVKMRYHRIFLTGAVSFGIVLLIIAAFWAFCPRTKSYSREVLLLLERKDAVSLYPSGKPFSAGDILSPAVLKKVYDENLLKSRVKFSVFSSCFFYSSSSNSKLAALDSEYQAKFARKNLSYVDLQNLQQEYTKKLQALQSTDRIQLSMAPNFALTETEANRILSGILKAWYELYSHLEARPYPQIESHKRLKESISRQTDKELAANVLILLEKTRVYSMQMQNMCVVLNKLLQGKNLSLRTGEYLGDIEMELKNVCNYKLNVLRQYVLTRPELQGKLDQLFILSSLEQINHELDKVNAKNAGAITSLKMITAQSQAGGSRTANSSGDKNTVQVDSAFFDKMENMIRNDVNNQLRAQYAEKALALSDAGSELIAEQKYYKDLLAAIQKGSSQNALIKLDQQSFISMVRSMLKELLAAGDKIVQFRDMAIKEYRSSRDFYSPIGNVKYVSQFRLPFLRIAVGLLALWALLNASLVFLDFYRLFTHGKIGQSQN